MPVLKGEPTLKDFQQYVREIEKERGFTKITVLEDCLLLGEEIGELFAERRELALGIDNDLLHFPEHLLEERAKRARLAAAGVRLNEHPRADEIRDVDGDGGARAEADDGRLHRPTNRD